MNKKRTFMLSLAAAVLLVAAAAVMLTAPYRALFNKTSEPQVLFRSEDGQFQLLRDGKWEDITLSGVNMGSAYPGVFPHEAGLSEDEYLHWFRLIGEMHANTIRVYDLQCPAFYKALLRYNESSQNPVYLIQGINFSDSLMYSEKNILDPANSVELFAMSERTVDAIHGDAVVLDKKNSRLDIYTADLSPYLIGYLPGVEWDELFVEYTNLMNPDFTPYSGSLLSCSNDANAFESFLASWGDYVLSYEYRRYSHISMLAFANWVETDPFINEVQLISTGKKLPKKNSESCVNTEHIIPTDTNSAGMFAAYNVYPYYPVLLQYGPYTCYKDSNGNSNPYEGYLSELAAFHSCPVMITEFGVPSCRSTAYRDIWQKHSHGGLNEKQQAEVVSELYRDILDSGCAGALVFTWQDEWFKRAWNEMQISDPDGRAFWSNAMCAEQAFGMLAFEPGSPDSIIYPDGELSDWDGIDSIFDNGVTSLSVSSDERYLYLLIRGLDSRPAHNAINLAFDITPVSGAVREGRYSFGRPVDFLLSVNRSEGNLLVHAPYDMLVYSMGDKLHSSLSRSYVEELTELYIKDNDAFRPVYRARGSIHSIMRHYYELEPAGIMKSGNANPKSPLYDSNADFCIGDDAMELRIPWQLLNFRDPSCCLIVDDPEKNNLHIKSLKIDSVYVAPYFDDQREIPAFGRYELEGWKEPEYHERLKPAYYSMQRAFTEVLG